RTEYALRFIHARAVVGLDALQVLLDDAHGGDAPALESPLDVGNGCLMDVEGSGALCLTDGRTDHDHRDHDTDGPLASVSPVHAQTISLRHSSTSPASIQRLSRRVFLTRHLSRQDW